MGLPRPFQKHSGIHLRPHRGQRIHLRVPAAILLLLLHPSQDHPRVQRMRQQASGSSRSGRSWALRWLVASSCQPACKLAHGSELSLAHGSELSCFPDMPRMDDANGFVPLLCSTTVSASPPSIPPTPCGTIPEVQSSSSTINDCYKTPSTSMQPVVPC